jgi:hypothetical protein
LETRRELFVDRYLIERLDRVRLALHEPRDEGPVLAFDAAVVQTGPHEMSIYVNQDYAQPTAHLRRYSLRLDGFASLSAPYGGGEMRS